MVGNDDRTYVMMMKLVVNLVVLIHSSCFYTHIHHIIIYTLDLTHILLSLSVYIYFYLLCRLGHYHNMDDILYIYSRSIIWLGMMTDRTS